MSSHKNNNKNSGRVQKSASPNVRNVSKAPRKPFPHLPVYIVLFVLLWIFGSFVYNDVFYLTEQNSYLAFDRLLEKEILDLWYGPLTFLGRFLLLSFRYPLFGGFVLALILTLFTWLMDYCLNLKGKWRFFSAVPAFVFLGFFVRDGLDIFYYHEAGNIFSFSFCALLVMAIAALVVRILKKRPLPNPLKADASGKGGLQWLQALEMVVLFAALSIFAWTYSQNTILTARMQHQMQEEDWTGMMASGLKATHPSRTVAAFYAIGCAQSDQITTKLFDLFYQYPKINLYNKTEDYDVGTNYYSAETNFFSGLVIPSYHCNMEINIIQGMSVYRLKQMLLACLVLNQMPLAEKYIGLISEMPFESDFVEKYRPYVYDYKKVLADANLSKVMSVLPMENHQETDYRKPVFLGYYSNLMKGRSARALEYSLATCLYAKNLPNFLSRIGAYMQAGNKMPSNFEEAVMIYNMKTPATFNVNDYSPYILSTSREILNKGHSMQDKTAKEKGRELRKDYQGSYTNYYFYQNYPDENYPDYRYELSKSTVN